MKTRTSTNTAVPNAARQAASTGVRLANDPESSGRVLGMLDDHMLQQIAEAGLDGALVAGFDFEVVGNRALLIDLAVGLASLSSVRSAQRPDGQRRRAAIILGGGLLFGLGLAALLGRNVMRTWERPLTPSIAV